MKLTKLIAVSVFVLFMVTSVMAEDRPAPAANPSLGDMARQERAKRMKAMQEKSVRIWTNDNMPARPASGGGVSVAGQMSPQASSQEPTAPAASAETAAGSEESASGEHDESYYRKRMSELQARQETHERQLSVLQQKQSQNQMQYYNDPNKTLQQEYSRSDINKAGDEVTKKQQEITDDQKAIDDLRDQLRREGHPAGWLR